MKTKHEISYNGFHGRRTLRVVGALADAPECVGGGRQAKISAAVAKRLRATVCGCEGCTCGEHVAEQDRQGQWWTRVGELDGNYPQR